MPAHSSRPSRKLLATAALFAALALSPLAIADGEPIVVDVASVERPACLATADGSFYDCRDTFLHATFLPAGASAAARVTLACSQSENAVGYCGDPNGYYYPLAASAAVDSPVASAHASHFAWTGGPATSHHADATVAGVASVSLTP